MAPIKLIIFFLHALAASVVPAHPGELQDPHHIKREVAKAHLFAGAAKRSLDTFGKSHSAQALQTRNVKRRAALAESLRKKRGISARTKECRRDLATLEAFEAVNHNFTSSDCFDTNTSASQVFGANTGCIVTPEVTDGPYYVTGELIRKNVKEALYSEGVDLYMEAQYIDIETCQPVPDVYVDIWNANSTGVYSGVESGQGGLNSTFLRGVQATESDGVVTFETIFPGHYDGRATHTNLLAHMNVTVFPNGTIGATSDNNITHIGQVFYNTDLRDAVEKTYPYNTNTQAVTTNEEDMWSTVQADTYYDPFANYIYLGDSLSDGLLAWVQMGINTSVNYIDADYYQVAAEYEADDGHAESSSMGGSGMGSSGNGTTGNSTSGAMPSGSAPAMLSASA